MRTNLKTRITPHIEHQSILMKVHCDIEGTPNPGDASVEERPFIEAGSITCVVVGAEILGVYQSAEQLKAIKFDLKALADDVLADVGEEALSEKLWEQDERHEAGSHG